MGKINPLKSFIPLIGLFTIINLAIFFLQHFLQDWKIDAVVLFWGNLLLFVASAASYFFYQKSITSKQPYGFLNFVYAGIFVKMFLCLIVAFIYIRMVGKQVNKPAIFTTMVLYLVYTAVELKILMNLSKRQKNV